MKIIFDNKINKEQITALKGLEASCHANDRTAGELPIDNQINYYGDMKCYGFAYNEECGMIGAMSLFAPGKDIVELSAMVHPDFRQQGIFRSMLKLACEEMERFGFTMLQFVHETTSNPGAQMLAARNLPLDRSEYMMEYRPDENPHRSMPAADLTLSVPDFSEIPELTELSAAIYEEDYEAVKNMVTKSMEDPNILSFTGCRQGEKIGICKINLAGPQAYLFGFGIAPGLQGSGLGRKLLNLVLDKVSAEYPDKTIVLDVDSENPRAYQLYLSNGFSVRIQYDYYNCSIADGSPR